MPDSPEAPRSTFDVVVIGSGPGGYVAAIKAASRGLRTAIIEKDAHFGGTCLHVGCIPSKVYLHTASLLNDMRAAKGHGVEIGEPVLDWKALNRRADRVIRKLAGGVGLLLKRNGVVALKGYGRLAGPGRVTVTTGAGVREYEAGSVLVATGSTARTRPFLPLDGERILTNAEMFRLPECPGRLGIIGAGAVGTEFATMFRSYGSDVDLFEVMPRVLPLEDEEVSDVVGKSLRKQRIGVRTGAAVESVEVTEGGVSVRVREAGADATSVARYDRLLVAVGRAPRTADIGLETVGITTGKGGFIPVDGFGRTSAPGVLAIGDVVATAQLAHLASAEAEAAVRCLAGEPGEPLARERIPAATYCFPEVGSVGLTEAAARETGQEIKVGKFPFAANSKANILGDLTGFVKVVAEARYGEVLGVHIVGPHATDLIAEAVVALEHEATLESLARSVHAHPTLSEALAEAALAALGSPLHA